LKNIIPLHKKQISLAIGVLLFLFFFFINPLALLPKAKIVLAVAMLMISWWIFDALPLAVVALLPIILGFIISTGFLSLWLSNTATTMMMYPIALSVIHIIEMNEPNEKSRRNFSIVLMLCIAYSSNFALGTIIGTPPNVAYVNYISDKFNYNIGFTDWMIVFMPLTLLLLLALYWVMVRWLFPNNIKHSESGAVYINEEVNKLGEMSLAEKRTSLFS